MSDKTGLWHTLWQGTSIVVQRDGVEVDRVHVPGVERVVVVYRGNGDSAADLSYAIFRLPDDDVVFPADTGIAGRLLVERQAFWGQRGCIYWVSQSVAGVPYKVRRGFLRRPAFVRLPRAELSAQIERWPLEGPQTWEERKWQRIERSRPFASSSMPAE